MNLESLSNVLLANTLTCTFADFSGSAFWTECYYSSTYNSFGQYLHVGHLCMFGKQLPNINIQTFILTLWGNSHIVMVKQTLDKSIAVNVAVSLVLVHATCL